jgi:hypothetical protein
MLKHKHKKDINEMLLEAHKKGVEQATDLSIRTGISLVVEKDGKIREVKPKYKYIRVPIKTDKMERHKEAL